MAGPQPMHPGYGQPQVVYVQQPQKGGGFLKGCIILVIVLGVLGLLAGVAVVGVTYWGMGKINEALNKETDVAIKISDDFMSKLAKGDIAAAAALCDKEFITEEQLGVLYKAYEPILKDNKGLTYKREQVLNISAAGMPQVVNDEWWIQLFPASVNGTKASAHFMLHRSSGASDYKIQSFGITGVDPEGDFKGGKIGSTKKIEMETGKSN